MLDAHNAYRALHGNNPISMEFNEDLAVGAQEWAE